AAREWTDLELAFGQFTDALTQFFGGTVHFVKALGPAGGHAPPDGGSALSGCRQACGGQTGTGRRGGLSKKATSLHLLLLFVLDIVRRYIDIFPAVAGVALR